MTIGILALTGELGRKILLVRFFFLSGIYMEILKFKIGRFSQIWAKYRELPLKWGDITYMVLDHHTHCVIYGME